MCGIIGGIAQRDIAPILLEGLKHLEYRGYDSAGMALISEQTQILERLRVVGKVNGLVDLYHQNPLKGNIGIAHTRWATHGRPAVENTHPLQSHEQIAVVHNGIIENFSELRDKLSKLGYAFQSDTDTEVIAHLLYHYLQNNDDMLQAVRSLQADLIGAYSLGIINQKIPDTLFAVRCSAPLVIGMGIGEHFIASDTLPLLPVTQSFIYLEDGDIAQVQRKGVTIYDATGKKIERETQTIDASANSSSKGNYRHFMLKEIFEQPQTVTTTLKETTIDDPKQILKKVKRIHLVACGTSYHAALVAQYWIEEYLKIPCVVGVASEYRYRNPVVESDSLFIVLSQSGETADTLAALRQAKESGFLATLGICNVPHSTIMRETDLTLLTRAGTEIGVAATKTFTAQLLALLLFVLHLAQFREQRCEALIEAEKSLDQLPKLIDQMLGLEEKIQGFARHFSDKRQALFLGRGMLYPIALEGALKLKEISYIFVEAYPAGELKHGTLALVDEEMPIVVVAPRNALTDKLLTNIHEVRARGGIIFGFADQQIDWADEQVIHIPTVPEMLTPIIYTIPLQLLAYHIAVLKGTDVDQPRNLAKSVTVE